MHCKQTAIFSKEEAKSEILKASIKTETYSANFQTQLKKKDLFETTCAQIDPLVWNFFNQLFWSVICLSFSQRDALDVLKNFFLFFEQRRFEFFSKILRNICKNLTKIAAFFVNLIKIW